ncbi:hypothetical protein HCN44_003621 [Aphidius gifuensis]|uniref:MOSC domain-containing protein n=2 Tax=Aphidius gifuensis TaxID=684658 RepID=A0A834XK88_APHGI|nr:hypothetical protein HCN44_003621 [Aphidius gifuensis]
MSWRLGIVSCGATVAVVLIFWKRFKNPSIDIKKKSENCAVKKSLEESKLPLDKKISKNNNDKYIEELPEPRWIKVGEIKELFYYPLKSGRGKNLNNCEFTDFGIAVNDDGKLTLKDRMFLVYNEENGKFITGRNHPTLILVSLSAVDNKRVKLEAVGMQSLTFELLPENSKNIDENIECSMWWGEKVKCIDCGDAPAEWISRFLTGTDSGLRIGLAPSERCRDLSNGPWERFTKVYDTLRNEDTGYFSDLTSYMLMTESSLDELNSRLENPTLSLQYRPNIVVSGTEAFDEDEWEWIKIGDDVVIRNVKPCPRCKMIKINPETAEVNPKEPFETLQSFRAQTDKNKIKVDGKAPLLGIYCGLYLPGNVKIGDDVFIHSSKTVCTTSV